MSPVVCGLSDDFGENLVVRQEETPDIFHLANERSKVMANAANRRVAAKRNWKSTEVYGRGVEELANRDEIGDRELVEVGGGSPTVASQ